MRHAAAQALRSWNCKRGNHDWSRWEHMEVRAGVGRNSDTYQVQVRECINPHCQYKQVEPLVVKVFG